MFKPSVVLLAWGLGLSAPAVAQDFYWGGGLADASGTSDNVAGGSGESDLAAGMLSLSLGQRFDRGSGFLGWEANADLGFGADTEGATTRSP
jgi:hypothetical protein